MSTTLGIVSTKQEIIVVKSTTFITKITQGSAVALLHYEKGLALHDSVTIQRHIFINLHCINGPIAAC